MARKAHFPGRQGLDPYTLPVDLALSRSEPLARLTARLRESRSRFETIRPALPPALRAFVQAGPVDEEGWTLLAANAGVAAKLRQLLPRLDDLLREAGWPRIDLRLKIAGRS